MTSSDAFCRALLPLATSSITVKAKTSTNNYGEGGYSGSGTTYDAHLQKITASDRTNENDEKLVEYVAYLPTTTYVPRISDQVVTPDGLTRPVIRVDVRMDEHGQQAVVLSLGKSRRM